MILKTNVTIKKRIALTGMLVFCLLLAGIFFFAPKAKAAGNKKTMYLPVEVKEVESSEGSGKSTTMHTCSYSKNGLIKTSSTTYGYGQKDAGTSKTNYKHYKKGPLKSYMNYYRGEKSESKTFTLNKKGQIAKAQLFSYPEGKKSLLSTTTYKYNKKGILTKTVEKGSGFKEIVTYYANGNPKQRNRTETYKYSDGTTKTTGIYKYDTYGNLISLSDTTDAPGTTEDTTTTETIKNSYNKLGDLVKAVSKSTDTYYDEGKKVKSTTKTVETRKYSYTKFGKISKCVSTNEVTIGGTVSTTKSTTTYKYKKFKVPKKLVPYAGEQD